MLFHDFPNKVFLGVFGDWDRSQALLSSFTQGAKLGEPGNPLYADHYWAADEDNNLKLKETPAIIHLATNVISGKNYVFAPFRFSFPEAEYEEFQDDNTWVIQESILRQYDTGIFNTAVASASFPYLTPSAALRVRQNNTGNHNRYINLVDGGYLDNSGAGIARQIVAELQNPMLYFVGNTIFGIREPASSLNYHQYQNCVLQPRTLVADQLQGTAKIAISTGDSEAGDREECKIVFNIHPIVIRAEPPFLRYAENQNFFFDPLQTVLNVQSHRAELARIGLYFQFCSGANFCPPQVNKPIDIGFIESVIRPSYLELPLGWHLTQSSIERLERMVAPNPNIVLDIPPGKPQDQVRAPLWDSNDFSTMNENPDNVAAIIAILDPNHQAN